MTYEKAVRAEKGGIETEARLMDAIEARNPAATCHDCGCKGTASDHPGEGALCASAHGIGYLVCDACEALREAAETADDDTTCDRCGRARAGLRAVPV